MTIDISNNSPRISYSVAAGVTQTSFAVPFEFFADTDLNVYIDEVLQTITTNYTVSGGDGSTGTLTMTVTGPKTVIITRDTTIERTTDFTAGVDINRAALNTQLDTLTAIGADVKDLAERAIRIKDFDPSTASLELPAASVRADKLLSFDTEGGVSVQTASDLLTGSVLGANYTKASHTGNGTIVAFSTTEAAGSKNNIQVYIDGVYQNKDTFSISGSTLTFSEAPPLNSAIEFIVGNAVTSLTTDPDVVTYNQGGTGAQDRTLTSKLQETVSVKDFGAVGDGVTDDTASINAALSSGYASVFFPSGNYLTTGNHEIPTKTRLFGERGTTIIPSGTPTSVFNITDNDSDQRQGIIIDYFALNGNCTYFIQITGGYSYVHTFSNLQLSGGSGTALIYLNVTSTTRAPSRWDIIGIDARKSGFDHVLKMTRSAAAAAADINADNFFIRRVNSWASISVIDIGFPVSSFIIRDVYGGLFAGNIDVQRVIKLGDDTSGAKKHSHNIIQNVHMEGWDQGCIALEVISGRELNISNIKSIRINNTKSGLRALKLSKVVNSFVNLVNQFDTGGTEISGYYPHLELDANCTDNNIMINGINYGLRVIDNGYRNIYPGIRNLRYLYSSTQRVTKTGVISAQENIKSFTIPAGQFGSSDGMRIFAAGNTTGAGTKRFQIIIDDGTAEDIVAQFWDTPAAAWRAEIDIWNVGSLANQRTSILTHWNGAIVTQATSSETTDFSNDVEVRIDVISISGSGDTIDVDAFYIEPIYNIA